ncbi:antA/AntB antirepressor family protein [Alkalicoccobacillus gibsonii]|uniref:antA/AntB antirepressor family protein n=1 Tax=Alkalicoccobacillus gibsonii TaxID=79881 RepID=UPI003F7CA6AA
MNELITTTQSDDGKILVSGRELHEFLGVRDNYTDWFKRMTKYGFDEGVDFIGFSRESSGGRRAVDHHIKLDMAKEISMIQRTDRGKEARRYFLKLEEAWNSPEQVMARALQIADRRVNNLQLQIEQDKPYTTFGKAVSGSDANLNIGAFCKMVFDEKGIKIGRNKMFKWLRDNGYLIKVGRERNNPLQKYVDRGWFVSYPTLVQRTEGDVQSLTTMITGKGQVKLLEALDKEKSHCW